jgi:HSP20 family protein
MEGSMRLVPLQNKNTLRTRDLNGLFEDFFGEFPFRNRDIAVGSPLSGRAFIPDIEFSENKDSFKLRAELPGLTESDFEVFVEDGVLTLKGEKKEERKEEGENYHHFETSYGSFSRSFKLPESVDQDSISANFKNGLLNVTMKKDTKTSKRKTSSLT